MTDEITCRICLDTDDDDRELISPCNCSGTMALVHRDCLQHWREAGPETAAISCELCKNDYKLSYGKNLEIYEKLSNIHSLQVHPKNRCFFFLILIFLFHILAILISGFIVILLNKNNFR